MKKDVLIKGQITWSLCILFYHLDRNKMFLSEMLNKDIPKMIQGGYKIPKPLDGPIECPEFFYSIMVDCCETKPEKRPSFKALHKMFKTYFILNTEEKSDEEEVAED